jgi:aryl-alcohol dehydrogenase-like predicted oxidoreductase
MGGTLKYRTLGRTGLQVSEVGFGGAGIGHVWGATTVSAPPPGFDDLDQGRSMPVAQANGVGVIGIRSHAAGALVDRLDREAAPDTEVARDHARALAIRPLLAGRYATLSQAALRFCLDNPAIATVTPGFKSVTEVEEAAACSDLAAMPEEIRQQLETLYGRQFTT